MKRKSNSSTHFVSRLLITALIFVMSGVMLTACGGSGSKSQSAPAEEENTITGTYTSSYEVNSLLNEQIESLGVTLDEPIEAVFKMDLKDDSSYTVSVDGEDLVEKMKGVLTESVDSIIDQMLVSSDEVSDMDKDEIAKLAGYDSYDAFREEMQKQMSDSIDESFKNELKDELSVSGTYKVEGTKLTLTSEEDGEVSIEAGTIQDDGSIVLNSKWGEQEVEMTFTK